MTTMSFLVFVKTYWKDCSVIFIKFSLILHILTVLDQWGKSYYWDDTLKIIKYNKQSNKI